MMNREKTAIVVIGALTLIVLTAGASAYVTKSKMADEPPRAQVQKSEKITWNEPRQEAAPQPQQQQALKDCDDANIVGTALGAVAGGIAGNQIGSGKGQDLATIGGAVGGGFLGNQYIPTRNVTCR